MALSLRIKLHKRLIRAKPEPLGGLEHLNEFWSMDAKTINWPMTAIAGY
ncbi:MAG: hypothetical protein ACRCU9_12405 [Iodobacter sp.]